MTEKQKKNIKERIKIYESIKILSETNSILLKKEIKKDITLTDKEYKNIIKKINILKAILLLINKNYYIKDIANELNLSTSCIQRYLNDSFIDEVDIFLKEEIKNKLQKNMIKGNINGGEQYVLFNEAIKLSNGHFCGSIKRI